MPIIRRRDFIRGALAVPVAACFPWKNAAAEPKRTILFAGTQTSGTSKGIYAYHWNAAQGEPVLAGLAAESNNPTFLAIDPARKFLYAANELNQFEGQRSGAVSSFAIDLATAKLKPLNQITALGPGTCHVSTDHEGRSVFCANYTGGSASSFYVYPDGQLSQAVSHFQYTGHGPNPQRQEAPHAHRTTPSPDNRFLLVNDLGLDCIHIYHLNQTSARLTPNTPAQWNATPGSGPRALRFHPGGRWAYCVHELSNEVEALVWNAQAGTLKSLQKVKLVSDDYSGPAGAGSEVVITRDGAFAYAASRFADVITSFSVNRKTGLLTVLGRTTCGGKVPRHIALDPSEKWLLAANQESDNIAVFARDEKAGTLAGSGKSFPLSRPQCLVFA
ncbi:lactonase family protein [Paracidobacterium acidisoli]|uniref:Lactonase family protein n=1 Tax=Paracidobacterium acidisoli TaxID=2303751 RepID=A0A372IN32_9BACT|nr:lactonase family protein [Paracidobacterium acidisoli]MBT9331787.1 lactonase family protein [Paracidobacterium acidisoli]